MTTDYKTTVNLPQTEFPMRGNLPTAEPVQLARWKAEQIYQKMVAKNRGRPSFTLQDGPPYANGSIHIGHALNKILKDIVIKYKNMQGFHAAYVPGWDCHGLPIEHAVLKKLGKEAAQKSDMEIRTLCRAEANHWIGIQKDQFERLGVFGDWEHPYRTMDPEFEAEEIREFVRAYEKGLIYLGTKPVYWNYFLKTALADAEVEYHPHRSPSIYVRFEIREKSLREKLKIPVDAKASIVIWTTTPWTLPANLGISLHPDYNYGVFRVSGQNEDSFAETGELLVFASARAETLEKEFGCTFDKLGEFKGSLFENETAQHPFYDRTSLLLLGNHVSLDAGTGAVHTAPGHGMDDYRVGLKYGLPILSPVGANGTYTDEVPEYKDIHIFKANPIIIERLKDQKKLLRYFEFEHSYPHCWRSKTPLFFRATPQWFLGMDLEKNPIRQRALEAVEQIQFYPEWGRARLVAMLENRPDWCLSRQRVWGVPIPVLVSEKDHSLKVDPEFMLKVADVVQKKGIDAFYEMEIPEGFKHGEDILDVWFDSGVCHAAVSKKYEGLKFPADIYLEGSDQHRGWFNTSLLSSLATNDIAPYKGLITHGFVNDSQGLKMSKSKGNTVDPVQTCAQSGAEILRLWTVYEDYGTDVTCGPDLFVRVTETYRRIRNTMRYLLGANFDFDAKTESVPYDKMTAIDQWILGRLSTLIESVTLAYDEYAFHRIYHQLNEFFTVDLSANYLDILKDRLYTAGKTSLARKSSQTAIYLLTQNLTTLMAPVLSFLAEEVERYVDSDCSSVFLKEFPKASAQWKNETLAEEFKTLFALRRQVQKKLEDLRNAKTIGSSLEAVVQLASPHASIQKHASFLREFFIVSGVDFKPADRESIEIQKAPGEKCVRCWNYATDIHRDGPLPDVCPKCREALGDSKLETKEMSIS